MRSLLNWLWVTRAEPSTLAAIATWAGCEIIDRELPGIRVATLSAAVALAFAGGFALHEVHDLVVDQANAPSRPLVRGSLSKGTVQRVGWVLIVAGLTAAAAVGVVAFAGVAMIATILWMYSRTMKPYWVLKNPSMAFLAMVPIALPSVIWRGGTPIVQVVLIGGTLILIREFILDLRDADGDRASGVNTIANQVSLRAAKRIGVAALLGWAIWVAAWGARLIPAIDPRSIPIAVGIALVAMMLLAARRPSYPNCTVVTQLLHGTLLVLIVGLLVQT